jgi:transcriptional regulator with XRE-family HTH domain
MVTRGSPNPRHYRLGERLRRERKAQGLSYRALAAKAGVSTQTPASVENARNMPGVDIVEKLARGLNVSPAWLAYGLGPKQAPTLHNKRKAQALADWLDTQPDQRDGESAALLREAYSIAPDEK